MEPTGEAMESAGHGATARPWPREINLNNLFRFEWVLGFPFQSLQPLHKHWRTCRLWRWRSRWHCSGRCQVKTFAPSRQGNSLRGAFRTRNLSRGLYTRLVKRSVSSVSLMDSPKPLLSEIQELQKTLFAKYVSYGKWALRKLVKKFENSFTATETSIRLDLMQFPSLPP